MQHPICLTQLVYSLCATYSSSQSSTNIKLGCVIDNGNVLFGSVLLP